MAAKVTANPSTRIIEMTEAPVSGKATIDVRKELYSGLKADWHSDPSLQKLKFPFRTFGDPARQGEIIGPYVFFENRTGWRLLPYDDDHELELINANLISEADVAGTSGVVWNARSGRTITIRERLSAQSLLLETGVSGLTASESATLAKVDNVESKIITLEKLKRNRMDLNDTTGILTVYDDDSVTPLYSGPAWANIAGTTAFDGTQPVLRRDRLA